MPKVSIKYEAQPAIDVSKIPKHEADHLARATLRAVKRYFEIPGVKEDYEKWLIEYRKEKKGASDEQQENPCVHSILLPRAVGD